MPLLCKLTLRKKSTLAIGSPRADIGGPASNPVRVRRSPAGGEQGSGLGPTRVRFVGLVGERSCRRVGAPATGGGGGCDCQSSEVAARWDAWTRRRATTGAREGGRRFNWGKNGRSDPRFAIAASNGAGGQHGERRRRWVRARCTAWLGFIGGERNRAITARGHPALTRCTASNLGRRAQGRPAADRWTTLCADGGEGRDSMWRGRGLHGSQSAPNLRRSGLEMARGGPDTEVSAAHARACATRDVAARRRPAELCHCVPV
jgi:hypothetical protein